MSGLAGEEKKIKPNNFFQEKCHHVSYQAASLVMEQAVNFHLESAITGSQRTQQSEMHGSKLFQEQTGNPLNDLSSAACTLKILISEQSVMTATHAETGEN
jgi:hypothetical protein